MYGGQSDEVGGEYWLPNVVPSWENNLGNIENRAASSCAHIYGKNLVSAESNTSGGPAFSRVPADAKQRTDKYFSEGINNTLLHVFIQQPDSDRYPSRHNPRRLPADQLQRSSESSGRCRYPPVSRCS